MSAVLKSLNTLLFYALELLPDSPFRPFIDSLQDIPYISALNWFIPVGDFITLLSAWTAAVIGFYAVSAILRFVQAID